MSMQDREFDDLFSSKLQHFEAEPTEGLWDNIAAQTVNKRKLATLPLIGVAASLLVLTTAGVLFLKSAAVIDHQPGKTVVSHNPPQLGVNVIKAVGRPAAVPQTTKLAIALAPKTIIKRAERKNKASFKQVAELPVVKTGIPSTPQKPLTAEQPGADVMVSVTVPAKVLLSASIRPVPDAAAQPDITSAPVQTAPVKTVAAARPKKHSISTFGDLINVVVATVDKRKDKLIEFSSKDDDESLITGVNLGIVKVKKEEVIATNK